MLLVAVGLLALLVWSLAAVDFFTPRLGWSGAFRNLGVFLADLVPPATDRDVFMTLGEAMVETIQMAYVGTLLGALIALPLAVLAARSVAHPIVAHAVRGALAVVRTIPSLLWALIFVIMVGLGPLAGMLGLAFYTLGYLGKLFYEAIEGVDPDVVEAMRTTGASKAQLVRHALLPEAANPLLSQVLFVFEYNIRASTIVGLVGAGGLGLYLHYYLQLFDYPKVATALLMLLAVVLAIEGLGGAIRRRFLATPSA